MIAVDTNVLVYAHREDSKWHAEAKRALTDLVESAAQWALPWPCVHEFLAVVTHPRIFSPPTPLDQALVAIDQWLSVPTVVLLGESLEYWPILRSLLKSSKAVGPKIHDARIAALCRDHAVGTIWSADRDFSRFRGVVVANPLTGA
jgi:toxin-antitoxin system PIN domain toxin